MRVPSAERTGVILNRMKVRSRITCLCFVRPRTAEVLRALPPTTCPSLCEALSGVASEISRAVMFRDCLLITEPAVENFLFFFVNLLSTQSW